MISFLELKSNKKISFDISRHRHFAIVMLAPPDEQMISKSLYSLFGLVYPKNMYDVILTGRTFSTNTANIAREMGARVLYQNGVAKKEDDPYGLQRVFEQILQGDKFYDAVVIIESDSLVSGNYLDVMNYYLDKENNIIQSNNLILPQWGQDQTAKYMGFLFANVMNSQGRKVLGSNMEVRGNGICFSTDLLRDIPTLADIFTRDMGFSTVLQQRNMKIDLAHTAILLTEGSASAKRGSFKRKRWGIGRRLSVFWHYGPKLIKAAFRHKSLVYFKSLLDLVMLSSVKILAVVGTIGLINTSMWALAGWSFSFVWLWICIAAMAIINILIELYAVNSYHQSYKSAL